MTENDPRTTAAQLASQLVLGSWSADRELSDEQGQWWGWVRFRSLAALEDLLLVHERGFQRLPPEPYKGHGYMLYYVRGAQLVRLKTRGEPDGRWKDIPHLSICITDGQGVSFANESHKIDVFGGQQPKSPRSVGQNRRAARTTNLSSRDWETAGAWAKAVHMRFLKDFDWGEFR